MKTTPTTAVNNLLIDYNKKIVDLQSHIEYNQKLIEKDKATINSFKEKINILHEVLSEINELTNTTDSKTTQPKCNVINNPVKPLTEEQVKKFTETFNKQNNSSILDDALKSLESNIGKNSFCFVDVKYNDEAKWPMDM